MLDDLPFDRLPPAWSTFDLTAFSPSKRLWEYQQQALENALKALWKYFEDFADYSPGEDENAHTERKARLHQWYLDNGLTADLDLRLSQVRGALVQLLTEFYPANDSRIAYEHFLNRMCFWMATGSGKSLVIVKLLEILWALSRLGEIPPHDILVLTHRQDLLDQLQAQVADYNSARGELYIRLRDLREYPEVKRETPSLFREHELTVFLYRSDNLSDEQKEKIIDFRNYEAGGRWYVLLDEAHKGDREDSKRQHIYSIMARNGFLFNFSATFTDPRDFLTTACDFNLARFIEAGYGKHLTLLRQENRAFRDDEDYTGEEKQKVVLKALMMLAYARLAQETMREETPPQVLYHRPLLLALVNSVSVEDADLKLFFRELARIGQGELEIAVWEQAKAELWQELAGGPEYLFEGKKFQSRQDLFERITPGELLNQVYNAPAPGDMEVLVRPSNRQELAFRLKSGGLPFALIKIGDITNWLRDELVDYEIIQGFDDEGYFVRLNEDEAEINILMGSRSFYEGWDSNRPNVMTFINIGTGTDARKFILQSVGRGVRIEPVKTKRRRLRSLYNAGEISPELFAQGRDYADLLETLFIFGTNRQALDTVLKTMEQEKGEKPKELSLFLNEEALAGQPLLIPVYRQAEQKLADQRDPAKFPLLEDELALLRNYLAYLEDDRLLTIRFGIKPKTVGLLHRSLDEAGRYFRPQGARRYGNLNLLIPRLLRHFEVIPQEMDRLKQMEEEICHFRHIQVFLADIRDLQNKIENARNYRDPSKAKHELREQYEKGEISLEDYTDGITQAVLTTKETTVSYKANPLDIYVVANHYYIPVILSHSEKVDYIRHIIRHPSEVNFIKNLDAYAQQPKSRLKALDWWLFSKIDESIDDVYLPYYYPDSNRYRRFYPDFIFWLKKGGRYFIIFVDPKGMKHTDHQHKIDGYERLFLDTNGTPRVFQHNGLEAQIFLALVAEDANQAPEKYRKYWIDNPEDILGQIAL